MKLEDLLAVIDDSVPVAIQVVDPDEGCYTTLVGPIIKSKFDRVVRPNMNPDIFNRTVESVRAFVDHDSQWSDPDIYIGVI